MRDHVKMIRLPLITDIKRHSLEDGPGIRSVVFFKGCPLRCIFCHNPEAQDPDAEIAFSPEECILCRACLEACPNGAIDLELPGRIVRDRCDRCGDCAGACPGKGLRIIGKYYPIEELTDVLLRDLPFYRHSGGGVTVSGGECTLYPDYLGSLLKGLKTNGIHIALQTSGHFDYGAFREKILPYTDLIYYDIKIADPKHHQGLLGKTNESIIGNLRRLLQEQSVEIHPRIPLIPEITATEENLCAIVDLLCDLGAEDVSLLPYNPMGFEMARSLGKPMPTLPDRFMKPDEEKRIRDMFKGIIERRGATSRNRDAEHADSAQ